MRLLGRLLAAIAIWRRVVRSDSPAVAGVEVDPSERKIVATRRMETLVAVLLLASALLAAAFAVLYVVDDATPLLGATAGLALACLAAALMVASLRVVPQVVEVEERPELDHGAEAQEDVAADLRSAGEGISRRGLLTGAAGACACGLGVMVAVPAASLGPRVDERLSASPWRRGRLLVDSHDEPVSADALEVGSFLTAFAQGADKRDLGSSLIVVRVPPGDLHLPAGRADWGPEGIVAYSKICTHAGCAVSEFRWPLSRPTSPDGAGLVCPCHYSTFDPTAGGRVMFGPAGRPLPQLPLVIDEGRRLRAGGELSDAPGPAWWGT
jgi:ubiquinol-cytochrome c reductase iron-sulfur subunit